MLLATTLTRLGIAAPLAHLPAAPRQAHVTANFALRSDARFDLGSSGARFSLGSRVGLFVDYKELRPASGALQSLDPGLPAKPPVRLGSFIVSAGIRFYFN